MKYAGELRFRKTYTNIQFITDDKEIDKYLKQQEKSNPVLFTHSLDSNFTILYRFQELGLICQKTPEEYELLLSKFNFQTNPSSAFYTIDNSKYNLNFFTDSSGRTTFFKLISTTDSIIFDTESTPSQDLNYVFIDIVPGGNKELVFLDDYHIMNGDNFDLKVYEIK
ncbi:MAG: hypothetical protein GXC73_13955 [Chitinophagaceae bacterium]|nr:hypothetical protein [Chitinophagaceae bacterium]